MKRDIPSVLNSVNGEKWQRIGMDRKAGVLVPLFSLRSKRSAGIGEILDLELLVDWCQATRQKIIQLLPVNDTAYDAPPYCAVSAFALNPVYLSLHDIPGIDPAEIQKLRDEFESRDNIVYWQVKGEKMRLLWGAYTAAQKNLSSNSEFQTYCRENGYWLDTYAAFMAMKDTHEQRSWRTWEDAPEGTPDFIQKMVKREKERMGFYRFLQWHLDRQWRRVRRYANERGVLLKGDIPYLLNNDAADVWAWRRFFDLDMVAGCPPDFYNADGQYWSFPTYRWGVLEKEGFAWWKERLKVAQKYFDIFRIDHVLGFFRIWSIPAGQSPWVGQFVPAVHVTKKLLTQNHISSEETDELVRRKLLLPAYHATDEYTFKWEFIKDEEFRTLDGDLKQRLFQMENYFSENDEIQNERWKEHGKNLLTMISLNTEMLICAEDLGTVPPCVRPCLEELGITKLLVDRWTKWSPTPKQKKQGMKEYWIEPWNYDPVSVSSPSNHDMPTLRGWWIDLGQTDEGRRERAEHFRRFGWKGNIPEELSPGGVRFILKRNLDGKSIFTIFFIQEILDLNPSWQSADPAVDRINLPGTYSDRNWSWRMLMNLEDLCAAEEFNKNYAALVAGSGR